MAATGKTPILLYGSTTATNTPSAGNLTNSSDGCEIAINVADKNLFFKDSTNAVNTVPIRQSSASSNGWLSSTDWSTFNSKQPAGTYVTSVTGTAPVVSSGGTTPAISMAAATGSVNGYLTSTDWTTFNNKAPAVTYTTSYIPYGQGTTTPALSNNLKFDGANFAVGGTLSVWNASYPAIEVTGLSLFSSSVLSGVANNAYLNAAGSAYVYKASSYATFYRMYQGEHKFYVAPSGTAGANITWTDAVTIDNSANLKVSTGNLVIGTSGKGIDFSATAGTGTSELLADYEEGTWTPTLTCASGTITLNSGYTVGQYTKVGRQVTLTCSLYVDSVSSPSGELHLNGFPYAVGNGNSYQSAGSIACDTLNSSAATSMVTYSTNNLTYAYIYHFAAGALGNAGADIKATSYISFSISYFTS